MIHLILLYRLKLFCELISKQRIEGNAYKYVAEMLAPKLTESGVMLILMSQSKTIK